VTHVSDLIALKRELTGEWLQRTRYALHAIGVGPKAAAGRQTTTLALRVYVERKLPGRWMSRRERIPSTLDGLPVDVVESPRAFIAADRRERQRCEPMCAGISIGRSNVTFGTLGAFCRSLKPDESDRILMLSNRHVLAGRDGAPGDPVFQPGPGDCEPAALRQVGTLLRSWPVEPGIIANRVDAAVAAVSGATHALTLLPGDAPMITGAARARAGANVCKFGRTSGFTEGFVSDLSHNVVVGLDPRRPQITATFIDQIRIERQAGTAVFADGGDSGAAILEKGTGQIVGLYFAGPLDGSFGLANHMADVTDFLQIELLA
jgi:hypothetical protein